MSASNPVAIPTVLINAQAAANGDTIYYTSPAGVTTIIDKFTATNTDGSTHTLNVNLIPIGKTVGAANLILDAVSISTLVCRDCTELQNQILAPGDSISCNASAASDIVIRASGRQ